MDYDLFADLDALDTFSADVLSECPEPLCVQEEIIGGMMLPSEITGTSVVNALPEMTREPSAGDNSSIVSNNGADSKVVTNIVKPQVLDQKLIDEMWRALQDLQQKSKKPRKRIREKIIDFWSTLPILGRKDVLPSEIIWPNKFSTASKCLQKAFSFASNFSNEWHARSSLKSLFGEEWSNSKKHLVGKNRNYLEPGDELKNNSFLVAKFNGDWQFIVWNVNQ
jgi:hypothetical protein